jgi:replicative DNA helicase
MLREAAHEAIKNAIDASKGKIELTLPMPWQTLQTALKGWPLGRMVMVMAITSGHKTTLGRKAAEFEAEREGGCSAYISLEDPASHLAARTLAERSMGMTTVGEIMSGDIGREDKLTSMMDTMERIDKRNPQMMIKHETLTLNQCVSRVYEAARKGAKLVVVDFFQLLKKDDMRMHDVSFWESAANSLQRAALECNVCLVLLVQPTQEGTKRVMQANTCLGPGDIRGGSAIAQAAFGLLVLSFELEEVDGELKRIRDRIHIVAQKWKSADVGTTMLFKLDGAYDLIEEWDEMPMLNGAQ